LRNRNRLLDGGSLRAVKRGWLLWCGIRPDDLAGLGNNGLIIIRLRACNFILFHKLRSIIILAGVLCHGGFTVQLSQVAKQILKHQISIYVLL